jgi:hypothetical protein
MPLDTVHIGSLEVSRFIIGGNPFSGFSHMGPERNDEMLHYYTVDNLKRALRRAEALGVNTHIGRADHFIMRALMEYWDEGGAIQWFGQTCPELGPIARGVDNSVAGGARACFIHGGVMDHLLANGGLDEAVEAVARIRQAGLVAGIAGHNPKVFEWAEENLDVDFYMCCYYNPMHRDKHAEHRPDTPEWFLAEDRDRMVATIRNLSRPAIHFKVLAAGRTDPEEAFAFVGRHLRPNDAVCVGICEDKKPGMIEENLRLLDTSTQGN